MNEQPFDSTAETSVHIGKVRSNILYAIARLSFRAIEHDRSKLEPPEKQGLDRMGAALEGLTYGSDEYRAQLRKYVPIWIGHHYGVNSHHPEHFAHPDPYPEGKDMWWFDKLMLEDGSAVARMTLLDLIEMLCDWKAASERHADGDFGSSLVINKERFGISDQLFGILIATAKELRYLPDNWQPA